VSGPKNADEFVRVLAGVLLAGFGFAFVAGFLIAWVGRA
jgi:hypothetical protein